MNNRTRLDFSRQYYEDREWMDNTHWLGYPCIKPPTDLWFVQQLIQDARPDVIIETGTAYAGSALFYACVCDMIGHGDVLTVDIEHVHDEDFYPQHPRLEYVIEDSVSFGKRYDNVDGDAIMVILDSDHTKAHVLRELEVYAPLVSVEQHLIIEDTNIPYIYQEWEPCPLDAVREWRKTEEGQKFIPVREPALTFHPHGYWKRGVA